MLDFGHNPNRNRGRQRARPRIAAGPAPVARALVRIHLAAAGEARRRGDHAAADAHETEAALAMRAAVAHGQRAEGARDG